MIYKNIKEMIGNTPLLKIDNKITKLKNVELYVKCELFNPFGSVKDRTALALIQDEIKEAKEKDKIVIEASSGNTAKALKVLCSMEDVKFKTVTNRIRVPETRDILKILGTEIEELPGLAECPDPSDPNDPVSYIEKLVSNDEKYLHTSQYTNMKNPIMHHKTGEEIYNDLGNIDYFFGVLGTTGSSRGIVEFLKEKNNELKKIGIIAEKGEQIPGIRNRDEMHEVGIFDSSLYNEVIEVSSMNAIEGMITLNRKVGLLAGPTTGGAYFATVEYLKQIDETLDKPIKVVFVACDRVEPYISYIKKRRPDMFDESAKVDSIRTLNDEDMIYAKTIEVKDVEEFIKKHNPIIIDLRGNLAYKNNHIKNSINITDVFFDDLVSNGLPFCKQNKVLLVCAVGDKSLKYSAYLNKKGLDVYSLTGGITEYKENDLPFVSGLKRNII